ncbi:MAG: HAD hydrolase-like protein [Luteitalea sp.]|nr:HAD hydrolase-like protein [Luteitalea sp.]
MSRSRFRLMVFDLDGTLVDSKRDLAESANAVLVHYGCRIHSEEAIGRMVGDGAATLVRRAFAAAGCSQPTDALDRFLEIYNRRLLTFTRPYEGVIEALTELAGRALLAVCTNKPLKATQTILTGLELARYFGARVVGGDGPFPRKPNPAGLASLMGAAAVSPSSTILIGDSIIDWETAHAAAAHVCMARYGFGFEGFPSERLTADDRGVDHPRELLATL